MLPFGVTIPVTVPQRSEIPKGLLNNPVYEKTNCASSWLFARIDYSASRPRVYFYIFRMILTRRKTVVISLYQRPLLGHCKVKEDLMRSVKWDFKYKFYKFVHERNKMNTLFLCLRHCTVHMKTLSTDAKRLRGSRQWHDRTRTVVIR
jgi:hypothetical protein